MIDIDLREKNEKVRSFRAKMCVLFFLRISTNMISITSKRRNVFYELSYSVESLLFFGNGMHFIVVVQFGNILANNEKNAVCKKKRGEHLI